MEHVCILGLFKNRDRGHFPELEKVLREFLTSKYQMNVIQVESMISTMPHISLEL